MVLGLFVLTAFVLAQPFWSVLQIQQGLQQQDEAKLETYIDFDSVRSSLKTQVETMITSEAKARLGDTPFAQIGIGIALKMTDTVVNNYVNPEGLATLFSGKADTSNLSKPKPASPEVVESQPDSPAGETPTNEEKQQQKVQINLADYELQDLSHLIFSLPVENGEPVKIKMTREIIRWRLSEIILPLPKAKEV